jgi:DNA-directed RNA polymerase sigma subunit (sigma70/sigma32)
VIEIGTSDADRYSKHLVEDRATDAIDVERAEMVELVQSAIRRLPPMEAQVIRLRYGLDGSSSRTLEETGHLLNLCKQRS